MSFKAKFIGTDSLGYEHEQDYELVTVGMLEIQRTDGSGRCQYDSLHSFMKNWQVYKPGQKLLQDFDPITNEIKDECYRQLDKWGEQKHPILNPMINAFGKGNRSMNDYYGIPAEHTAKNLTDTRANDGQLTYMDILIEEIAEAVSCGNDIAALRKELIQSAAVLVSMIKSLDRNGR